MDDVMVECQGLKELLEIRIESLNAAINTRKHTLDSLLSAMETRIYDKIDDNEKRTAIAFQTLDQKIEREVARLNEIRELRTGAVRLELGSRIDSHMEHHGKIHEALALASEKTEKAIDEKFARYNAFREQINTERNEFVRRDTLEERLKAIDARTDAALDAFDKRIRPSEGFRLQLAAVVTFAVIFLAIVDFVIRLSISR